MHKVKTVKVILRLKEKKYLEILSETETNINLGFKADR